MKLDNKRMVITGGTSGIGFPLAAQAKRRGARVSICGRDGDRPTEACERLGVEGVRCDLGDPTQLVGLLEAAEHRIGGLDVLVNNAGIQRCLTLTDEELGNLAWSEATTVQRRRVVSTARLSFAFSWRNPVAEKRSHVGIGVRARVVPVGHAFPSFSHKVEVRRPATFSRMDLSRPP